MFGGQTFGESPFGGIQFIPGVVREEVHIANIPNSRPIYKSKDWTEVVNDADPPPHVYVNYQFSNGRKFKG